MNVQRSYVHFITHIYYALTLGETFLEEKQHQQQLTYVLHSWSMSWSIGWSTYSLASHRYGRAKPSETNAVGVCFRHGRGWSFRKYHSHVVTSFTCAGTPHSVSCVGSRALPISRFSFPVSPFLYIATGPWCGPRRYCGRSPREQLPEMNNFDAMADAWRFLMFFFLSHECFAQCKCLAYMMRARNNVVDAFVF